MDITLKPVFLELCEISSYGELDVVTKDLQEVHRGSVGHAPFLHFLAVISDPKYRGVDSESI